MRVKGGSRPREATRSSWWPGRGARSVHLHVRRRAFRACACASHGRQAESQTWSPMSWANDGRGGAANDRGAPAYEYADCPNLQGRGSATKGQGRHTKVLGVSVSGFLFTSPSLCPVFSVSAPPHPPVSPRARTSSGKISGSMPVSSVRLASHTSGRGPNDEPRVNLLLLLVYPTVNVVVVAAAVAALFVRIRAHPHAHPHCLQLAQPGYEHAKHRRTCTSRRGQRSGGRIFAVAVLGLIEII